MSNITVTNSNDGRFVMINITEQGQPSLRIPMPAGDAGLFAMAVIHESIKCARITGQQRELRDPEQGEPTPRYVVAHGVGLSEPTDREGLVVLSFAAGCAEISLGISREHVRALGQSLVTMSADLRSAN